MNEIIQGAFLGKKMADLRDTYGKTQVDMAKLLNTDKATLSRAEKGIPAYKTIEHYAREYCKVLGLTAMQIENFFRVNRVVVTDTSALLKNDQLLDELSEEYNWVIVPDIVLHELDNIKDQKNRPNRQLAAKAWRIINSVTNNSPEKGSRVISRNYIGDLINPNNDEKIIDVAERAADEFRCDVEIITYDTGYSARLSGSNGRVKALYLLDYQARKQKITNMDSIVSIDNYYAESYDDIEDVLGITIPSKEELNVCLDKGLTLIISVIRNGKRYPLEWRKRKIRWLIDHGADVNARDRSSYYIPALSHCVQCDEFELFKFLLHDCNANPNVGSRNPYDSGKLQQREVIVSANNEGSNTASPYGKKKHRNDGNMPLMIAAWDNKIAFVQELCNDERTSLNQQDANGFTALIKASYWGWTSCRNILKKAGADTKIVDRDGFTEEDRYHEYLETGRKKNNNYR